MVFAKMEDSNTEGAGLLANSFGECIEQEINKQGAWIEVR